MIERYMKRKPQNIRQKKKIPVTPVLFCFEQYKDCTTLSPFIFSSPLFMYIIGKVISED